MNTEQKAMYSNIQPMELIIPASKVPYTLTMDTSELEGIIYQIHIWASQLLIPE
jgi:hypothetical protein